jgi:TatD DNase family protein
MAKQFVKLGMMIGIGGVVTFKNARKLVEVAEKLPIEHIVLETDSPYMAPAPYRGVRNDPGMLPYVAAKIAELKGMKVEDVVRITTENAIRVYRLRNKDMLE